jgi:hypothetical protein
VKVTVEAFGPRLARVTYEPRLLERLVARFHAPTRELLAVHRHPRWATRTAGGWVWGAGGRRVEPHVADAIEREAGR